MAVAIYVVLKLQNEEFVRGVVHDEMERQRREDLQKRTFQIESLDAESRVKMKAIVKLLNEISQDVENLPASLQDIGLTDTVNQTQHIVDRALAMAQKKHDLQHYLSKTDEQTIQSRISSLEQKLQQETDQARRSEAEVSLTAKQRELADYLAIRQSAALIMDQLDTIENSFASLHAKLVRIKSTDIAEWTSANDQVKTELDSLNTAVDTVELSVNEALSTQLPE